MVLDQCVRKKRNVITVLVFYFKISAAAHSAASALEDVLGKLPPSEELLDAINIFRDRVDTLNSTSTANHFLSTAGSPFLRKRSATLSQLSFYLLAQRYTPMISVPLFMFTLLCLIE